MAKALAELRAHPRLAAPVRACVLNERGERSEIPVRDVSLGGIFLLTPVLIAPVGEERTLELGTPDGSYFLTIRAEVVRAVQAPDSTDLLGLGWQFVDVTEATRARLGELLQRLMSGSGGERRAFPRLSYRVRVQCEGDLEASALLRDLSVGGAGLWVDTPVVVGQRVILSFERGGKEAALKLSGKVVTTRWPKHEEPYGQAGVQFDTPTAETKAALGKFLGQLLVG